jgi:hypothetical protein
MFLVKTHVLSLDFAAQPVHAMPFQYFVDGPIAAQHDTALLSLT